MKITCAFVLLQAAVVSANNFVPLYLGADFQSTFSDNDLLRGFKLNVAEGENALKAKYFEGEIDAIPFTTSFTKSAVIASSGELNDMMEIEGRLAVSYGPLISGEGAGSFLENKVSSKKRATILYRTRRVAYAKSARVDTLQRLRNHRDLNRREIAENFGTKFVDQIVYGAQLDVIFTVTSTKEIDIQEIEAQLKGKIGVGVLSVEFEAKFEKREGSEFAELQMDIEARSSGVDFEVPANPSFEEVYDLIDNFNKQYSALKEAIGEDETVDTEKNVLKQLSPVGFTVSSIADHERKMSKMEAAALDSRMEDLQRVFYEALFWKSTLYQTLKEVDANCESDGRCREEVYYPFKNHVEPYLTVLEEKITECLNFRGLSIDELVHSDALVPEEFPKEEFDDKALHGLIGEGFIKSPLRIGGMTFMNVHYVGFTIPAVGEEKSLEPWLSGTVRLDLDNSVVASANTPEVLAKRVNETLSSAEKPEWYVHLQLGSHKYAGTTNTIRMTLTDDKGNEHSVDFTPGKGQALIASPSLFLEGEIQHVKVEILGTDAMLVTEASFYKDDGTVWKVFRPFCLSKDPNDSIGGHDDINCLPTWEYKPEWYVQFQLESHVYAGTTNKIRMTLTDDKGGENSVDFTPGKGQTLIASPSLFLEGEIQHAELEILGTNAMLVKELRVYKDDNVWNVVHHFCLSKDSSDSLTGHEDTICVPTLVL